MKISEINILCINNATMKDTPTMPRNFLHVSISIFCYFVFTSLISFLLIVGVSSCSSSKPTIQPIETVYVYKDTTVIHTDTIHIDLPNESMTDVVIPTDTLHLETSLAKAEAYIDTTTNTLKGSIENKDAQIEKEIIYKDKIIEKQVFKEIPIEVVKEVKVKDKPWYFNILSIFALLGLATLIRFIKKILNMICHLG